jgi:hypothetical protein
MCNGRGVFLDGRVSSGERRGHDFGVRLGVAPTYGEKTSVASISDDFADSREVCVCELHMGRAQDRQKSTWSALDSGYPFDRVLCSSCALSSWNIQVH